MFDKSPVRGGSIWRDAGHRGGARPQPAGQQHTTAEGEVIATLKRLKERKLSEQEINLSLEQGRAIG